MIRKFLVCSILSYFSFLQVSAQYYETGQDPSSIKWEQISSGHFKIVFPDSYYGQATKFAATLEKAYLKLSTVYPLREFKIPVVIHSFSVRSNGYVSWAPKRMELYPLADQNNLPMDQVEQLVYHELDHVMEIQSLNQGFSRGMSYIFGEQFTGALSAYIPLWFLEGDAVYSETQVSGTGRGNNPAFVKQMKALIVEKDHVYKYDKMINGSFKDYTSDHYQFGYQMVAWSKNRYDPEIWRKTLLFTAKKPFLINPVNFSLRAEANLTKKKLFDFTFEDLKETWQKEDSTNSSIQYESINPPKKDEFINYYSPVPVGTDSIIAIKTSLSNPPVFVLINKAEKTEKRLLSPGSMYPYFLSFSNNKITWAETLPDPRWENREYSVIKVLDIKKNKITQLTRKSRFMAPSFSPDGRSIAVVESTPEYQNSLVILDALTGIRINSIKTPENVFPQRPQWSDDGSSITIIYLSTEGEGIMSYNLNNKIWETLIHAYKNDLQSAYLKNDSLFFVSSSSGIDNIYCMTRNHEIFRITSSRFGAYDLNLNNNSLLFTDYTSAGYNISSIFLDRKLFIPENNSFLTTSSTTFSADTSYTPEPYNKFLGLLNFHSWMPFYVDIEKVQSDPLSIKPGVTILSQNLLSTLTTSIGYEYNNRNHLFHSQIKWKGWYPTIQAEMTYGGEAEVLKRSAVEMPQSVKQGFGFITDLILPLSFAHGRFSQFIRPSISATYNNKYIYVPSYGRYDYGQTRITSRFYFANYTRSAFRDIFPRFGQIIDYSYTFSPFDNEIYGSINSLKTTMYLPGLFRNQGIRLRFETDIQKPEMYLQYNRASFPRGYKNIISENLKFYSADYAIPLFYPDFNIGSLIYLKRIRSTLFYDYGKGSGNSHLDSNTYHAKSEVFSSLGLELRSDFYLLRVPFMISAGVQTTYLPVSKSVNFNMLFNIDIFGMQVNKGRM